MSNASPSAALPRQRPPRAQAWVLAARPHTLSLSAAPVVAGCALAWAQAGTLDWATALVTLLAAMLIQVGTNLLNDVGDFERGADTAERLGPLRATAQGWLPARAVRRAGSAALAGAFVLGIYLAWLGGWPIVGLGLVALLCGWGYTSGPHPIAYGPLGEVFVWVFFGVAAVAGTCWLQTGQLQDAALLTGHILGALAAAVMLVNNTRDAATDARAGKRTLAVALGLGGCRALYAALLLQGFVLWPWLARLTDAATAWPLLALPWALWLVWRFASQPPGTGHNALLAGTARLQAGWTLLLVLALQGGA